MSTHKRGFLDTNVLLYLLDLGTGKADLAEALLATKPVISIQVLSEFTSVARRKLAMAWNEIQEITETIRAVCSVESLRLATWPGDRKKTQGDQSLCMAILCSACLIQRSSSRKTSIAPTRPASSRYTS